MRPTSRVLFCSFDTPGTLFPMIGLAVEMQKRGHDVAFASNKNSAEALLAHDLRRIPRGSQDGPSLHMNSWATPQDVDIDLRHLEYAARQFNPDIVVTHALCLAPLLFRERRGIPVAVLGLMSYLWPRLNSSAASPFPLTASLRDWRLSDMANHLNASRAQQGLRRIEVTPDANPFLADLYMLRSIPALEASPASLPENVHFVGACFCEAARTIGDGEPRINESEFLRSVDERPVMYVHNGRSFGKKTYWALLAEAFAGEPIRVLASIGRLDGELGRLPPNFTVARHMPQGWVQPRAACTLSAGHSTPVLGAIVHGCPSIVVPRGGETPDNAERLSAAGASRELAYEGLSPESIRAAVYATMSDTALREATRSLQKQFTRLSSFSFGADLLEQLALHRTTVRREDASRTFSEIARVVA